MDAIRSNMNPNLGIVRLENIQLQSGIVLSEVEVAYERTGNESKPVILICHALTGNQHAAGDGWWSGLIGDHQSIDTTDWQVICMNVLGGCHGTTGPINCMPGKDQPYQTDFPLITIRDIVHVQYEALMKLGIRHIHAVIGGSLGGMQVLEFGIMYPAFMDHLFPLAVTPFLSDYAIAFNLIGRKAIMDDPLWNEGRYEADRPPIAGLSTARMIGMVTYRSPISFNERFDRGRVIGDSSLKKIEFDVESYLSYQGEKLTKRFDANSYLVLLKAMDSHDIGRGRGGWEEALKGIQAPLTAIAYTNDLLYPPEAMEQMTIKMSQHGQSVHYQEVETKYGHDGFLVEFEKWGSIIKERLYAY